MVLIGIGLYLLVGVLVWRASATRRRLLHDPTPTGQPSRIVWILLGGILGWPTLLAVRAHRPEAVRWR